MHVEATVELGRLSLYVAANYRCGVVWDGSEDEFEITQAALTDDPDPTRGDVLWVYGAKECRYLEEVPCVIDAVCEAAAMVLAAEEQANAIDALPW